MLGATEGILDGGLGLTEGGGKTGKGAEVNSHFLAESNVINRINQAVVSPKNDPTTHLLGAALGMATTSRQSKPAVLLPPIVVIRSCVVFA